MDFVSADCHRLERSQAMQKGLSSRFEGCNQQGSLQRICASIPGSTAVHVRMEMQCICFHSCPWSCPMHLHCPSPPRGVVDTCKCYHQSMLNNASQQTYQQTSAFVLSSSSLSPSASSSAKIWLYSAVEQSGS